MNRILVFIIGRRKVVRLYDMEVRKCSCGFLCAQHRIVYREINYKRLKFYMYSVLLHFIHFQKQMHSIKRRLRCFKQNIYLINKVTFSKFCFWLMITIVNFCNVVTESVFDVLASSTIS